MHSPPHENMKILTLCLLFYKFDNEILRWIFWSWKHTNKQEFIQNYLRKIKIRKLSSSSAFLGCIHGMWIHSNHFQESEYKNLPGYRSGRLLKFAFFLENSGMISEKNLPHLSDHIALYFAWYSPIFSIGKPLFEMCCFHMGMALKGGGVKACHGLKHFFSYVCPFDRGGGVGV